MTRTVLLIGPKFFGYASTIVSQLNSQGINAVFIDERGSNNFFHKAIYRSGFLTNVFKFMITRRRRQLYKEIEKHCPTDVIFISPEYMCHDDFYHIQKSGRKIALYMWDSFANKPAALNFRHKFDRCMSFDFEDAEKYNISLLNLFAEPAFFPSSSQNTARDIDISFIGTLHSNRTKILCRLKHECIRQKYKYHIHGFYGNYYYYLRSKVFELYKRCSIGTWNSLSKDETANIFINSSVVLDVTHPNQNGLTSRTYEALASGAVLLTNNKNAPKFLKQYHSQIFTFDEYSLEKDLVRALSFSKKDRTSIDSSYLGLQRFCRELLQ